MTTRTKLNITINVWSVMMLLNVFSKPIHIPEQFQWVLTIGVVIPLGLSFYFIKKQKQEKLKQPVSTEAAARAVADTKQSTRKRLILMMVLCAVIGLCAPLWLPVTGSSLGTRDDFICGVASVIIMCTIFGIRLRKL